MRICRNLCCRSVRPSTISGTVNCVKLSGFEIFWRDHQKWLQERGYMLRPRYMPDWKASWLASTKKPYWMCEDGDLPMLALTLMDATRISDGPSVALKSIQPSVHPYEIEIGTYLSSKPLASDPQNHCVPIHKVLDVPDVDDRIILVMPLLQTFGESVDFFQQIFEVRGLIFSLL
ncbi:hypothetical protein PILCRDRAFT_75089 [Piloderma croceum F 1598]|uniref:Uncharacterized protein n=1 Tax=Piloderma croceum (strain F 1598) TaxID=765440 RepID=A0A0C3AXR5_PILCF|nr:hypothetical protein PILCRDRAFT_75089 [Piloderma croceum F 1598]